MKKVQDNAQKNDDLLETITCCGLPMTLKISPEAIIEFCIEHEIPIVTPRGKLKSICNCGCNGTRFITVVGVGYCENNDPKCDPDCSLRNGKKNGLWVLDRDVGENVSFVNLDGYTLELP